MRTLTGRKEWQFFSVLPKADPLLAAGWWIVLLLRGVLPAIFAIATGMLVAAVQNAGSVERRRPRSRRSRSSASCSSCCRS